jgi:hypothetical protein
MSFKEVKELRRQGLLQEALTLAKRDIEAKPEEIWNRRSLGWVYYDFLKLYADQINHVEFRRILGLLSQLNLPLEEKMIFDKVAWQVGKLTNSISSKSIIPKNGVDGEKESTKIELFELIRMEHEARMGIFNIIKDFHFSRPSISYSFLLKIFMKHFMHYPDLSFLNFADWWNFDNFLPEDHKKRVSEDGKSYMSLAEQAYINYSKQLLKKLPIVNSLQNTTDNQMIERFIPKLENIIKLHPEWDYPLYFKAKLFLALGKNNEVREFIMPFAKRKRSEFWVWALLADTFQEEDEHKIACLCKALSLESNEKMTVNVHRKLGKLLRSKGLITAADSEITISNKIEVDNKSLATEIEPDENLSNPAVPESENKMKPTNTNKVLYLNFVSIADAILFSDVPMELAVVEFVNKDKKVLNFVISKERSGFLKYDRFLKSIEIGDRLLVRLEGNGINQPYKAITVEKTDKSTSEELLKSFKGNLRKNENQPFGFVGEIFIESKLIEKQLLTDGEEIKGISIISFNRKKNLWGWKAINVKKIKDAH